jgi:hypothetical protein
LNRIDFGEGIEELQGLFDRFNLEIVKENPDREKLQEIILELRLKAYEVYRFVNHHGVPKKVVE